MLFWIDTTRLIKRIAWPHAWQATCSPPPSRWPATVSPAPLAACASSQPLRCGVMVYVRTAMPPQPTSLGMRQIRVKMAAARPVARARYRYTWPSTGSHMPVPTSVTTAKMLAYK